jgi:hypothetical protein
LTTKSVFESPPSSFMSRYVSACSAASHCTMIVRCLYASTQHEIALHGVALHIRRSTK